MLRRYFILILCSLLYSNLSLGILELELHEDVNGETQFFSSGNGVNFGLLNHEDGGDESTLAGALDVYIPVADPDRTPPLNVAQDFILPNNQIMNLQADSVSGNNAFLRFSVSVNLDSADVHRIFAIGSNSSSNYKILGMSEETYDSDSPLRTATFNVGNWCNEEDHFLRCSDFTAGPEGEDTSTIVAFVLRNIDNNNSADPLVLGADIELIPEDRSLFLNLDFSSEQVSGGVTAISARAGDSRLKLTYSGTAPSEFYTTVACVAENDSVGYSYNPMTMEGIAYAATSLSLTPPYPTCPRLDDLDIANTSGELNVPNLTNSVPYHISLFFVSKHKIATGSSAEVFETPREILAILEKQACFLLTAGFEGSHPIIDYFRNFRDTILSKTFLGKAFIKQYYKFGPKAAPYVLKHKWLGQIIRTGAHGLYFIFKNIYLILIFLLSTIMIFASFKMYRSKYGRP